MHKLMAPGSIANGEAAACCGINAGGGAVGACEGCNPGIPDGPPNPGIPPGPPNPGPGIPGVPIDPGADGNRKFSLSDC